MSAKKLPPGEARRRRLACMQRWRTANAVKRAIDKRAWWDKNKARILAEMKAAYAADPDAARLAKWRKQGIVGPIPRCLGLCEGCGVPGQPPVLHLDHCHTTMEARGYLCGNCNRALGLAKDSSSVLRRLAAYLEEAT